MNKYFNILVIYKKKIIDNESGTAEHLSLAQTCYNTRLFCLNRQFHIEHLTLIASEAIHFCIYLLNVKLLYSIQ